MPYRGVYPDTGTGKFSAWIGHNGKRERLGTFDDEVEAAKAYDEKAIEFFGDKAKLNFPRANGQVMAVPLENLDTSIAARFRAQGPNEQAVDEYAENIDKLPPGDAFFDGQHYFLAGGLHRWHAHQKAGKKEMQVTVRQGTERDAILFASGQNDSHGVRRTPADKRLAVIELLKDKEWKRRSMRWIAEAAKVSGHLVSAVIESLPPEVEEEEPEQEEAVGEAEDEKPKAKPKPKPKTRVDRRGKEQPERKDKSPKNGSEVKVYDDKIIDGIFRDLAKASLERAKITGKTKLYEDFYAAADAALVAWKAWKKG